MTYQQGKVNSEIGQGTRDAVTTAIIGITSDHHSIHDGGGFAAWQRSAAVASGASVFMGMTTPAAASGYVHLKSVGLWTSGGEAELKLYETVTSYTGTAFTPVNRKRVSPSVSASTIATGVTFNIGSAIQIDSVLSGNGGPGVGTGGARNQDQEMILAASTKYLFKMINRSAAAATVGLWLFWYEEA